MMPYDPDDDATKTPARGYGEGGADHLCRVCGQDNDPSGGGCYCYGIPTPVPHHPSTAELAAFRADLAIRGRVYIVDPPADAPRRYDHRARPVVTDPLARPVSGAWESERREGIGWTARSLWTGVTPPGITIHAEARREASALRSRAFARVDGDDTYTDAELALLEGLASVDDARRADERRDGVPR